MDISIPSNTEFVAASRGSPVNEVSSASPTENITNVQLESDVSVLTVDLESGNLASTRTAYLTINGDINGPPMPTPEAFLNAASIAVAAAGMLQSQPSSDFSTTPMTNFSAQS